MANMKRISLADYLGSWDAPAANDLGFGVVPNPIYDYNAAQQQKGILDALRSGKGNYGAQLDPSDPNFVLYPEEKLDDGMLNPALMTALIAAPAFMGWGAPAGAESAGLAAGTAVDPLFAGTLPGAGGVSGSAAGTLGGGMFDLGDPSTWGAGFGESGGLTPNWGGSSSLPFDLGDPSTWGPGYGNAGNGPPGVESFMGGGGSNNVVSQLTQKLGSEGAKSLLQRVMGGEKSALDLLSALVPGALAAFGSNQQSNSLQAIADRAREDRAPFLNAAKGLMAGGPEAWANGIGAGAVKGILHKLSPTFGNPIGSGTALQLATDSAANNWLNQTSQLANLGLGGNTAALDTNAVNAGGGVYTGLADAAARTLTPQDDLASILRRLQSGGLGGLSLA